MMLPDEEVEFFVTIRAVGCTFIRDPIFPVLYQVVWSVSFVGVAVGPDHYILVLSAHLRA